MFPIQERPSRANERCSRMTLAQWFSRTLGERGRRSLFAAISARYAQSLKLRRFMTIGCEVNVLLGRQETRVFGLKRSWYVEKV